MIKTYPKISIVTTNYNGGIYLEQAIVSVLEQRYPNLEYIIIDGGSTDGSQKIIEKYETRLAYWESEKDRGFAHAYNKGFAKATGDIFAYLNSDDLFCPWAFQIVAHCFNDIASLQWLTSLYPMLHSTEQCFVYINPAQPFNRDLFYSGFYGRKLGFIQQESTFWRRTLWEKAGAFLDESLHFAIDGELWARFFQFADLYAVATPLAGFRYRTDSKSGSNMNDYIKEMSSVLKKYRTTSSLPPYTWSFKSLSELLFLDKSRNFKGQVIKWDVKSRKYFAETVQVIT